MRLGYVNQGGVTTGLDGSIEYDFQGHVHADGLDLDAGVNSVGPDNKVRWLDATTGAELGWVGTSQHDGMELHCDPTSLLINGSRIAPQAGLFTRTLLDTAGQSEFVRARGGAGDFWIGGVYQIDSGPLNPGDEAFVTLTHNLGRIAYPLAAREDLNWAYLIGWHYSVVDVNHLGFVFRHNVPSPPGGPAQLRLNVFLVTTT